MNLNLIATSHPILIDIAFLHGILHVKDVFVDTDYIRKEILILIDIVFICDILMRWAIFGGLIR